MRRASLFIVALIMLTASFVYAENTKVGRYYVGIGVSLNKAEDGNFVVNQVLSGASAANSGIKEKDVIVEIDGQPSKFFHIGPALNDDELATFDLLDLFADKEGRTVNLKIIRNVDIGEFGDKNFTGKKELSFDVYCVQIDRASLVPMDYAFRSSSGTYSPGNVLVSGMVVESMVSEDKSRGVFIYRYNFVNTGNTAQTKLIRNFVIDKIFSRNSSDRDSYLKLDPGKSMTFVWESEYFPTFGRSTIRVLETGNEKDKSEREAFQKIDTYFYDLSNVLWLFSGASGGSMIFPAEWADELEQKEVDYWKR